MPSQTRVVAVLALLLLVLQLVCCKDPFKAENRLLQRKGFKTLKSKKECDSCAKGVFATKAYRKGEQLGRLDLHDCIDLGTTDTYLPNLLYQVLLDDTINTTHSAYLKTLPRVGQLTSYITLTEEHREMLQTDAYDLLFEQFDDVVAQLTMELNNPQRKGGRVGWVVPKEVTRHYLGLVLTRSVQFNGEYEELHHWMCPVLDIIRRKPIGNVGAVDRKDGILKISAAEDIAEGAELSTSYPDGLGRPDLQLLLSGSVALEPTPVLSLLDEAGFNQESVFDPIPISEPKFSSRAEAASELARVKKILASLDTSEEEDRAIMRSGKYSDDPVAQEIMAWRVQRKHALKLRMYLTEERLNEL